MNFNVREEIIALTPQWKGERLPDGRPKVDEKYLKALKTLTLEEVWKPIFVKGYESQFEGRLHTLINEVSKVEGIEWIRLMYAYPERLGDDVIDVIATNPKVLHYLDLPIQHINDRVLKSMNRKGGTDIIMSAINRLRAKVPDISIRTSLITGYPGETEEDFLESAEMCRAIGFSHIHTFKYSIRNGTKAARMPNQVPDKIKTERSAIIRQISAENKKRYFEQMLGKSQKMLIERISADGIAQGYGENYIPMRLKNKDLEKNTFVNVVVDSIIEKGDNSEVRASQQIRQ